MTKANSSSWFFKEELSEVDLEWFLP